jgi:hypothetical protein
MNCVGGDADSVDELRQGFGGCAEDDFVEGARVEGLLGTYINRADATLVGDVDEAGGWVDGAGGAYDEEGRGTVEFAVDGVHVEWDFAEPDDVGSDGGVAGFADWEVIGVFVEGLVGKGLIGASTAGLKEAAMHVVDAAGASALMEVVYVLGAEVEVVWICLGETLFDLRESFVGGIGLGGEGVSAAL